MGLAIAPQAANYIEMLLEGGEEKLVIFGWHVEVLDILQAHLKRFGLRRTDGSTTPALRDKHVSDFQSDPTIRVMLGNLLSLGTGTDGLQRVCNHALIVEPDWVPGNNIQAFDRLDRGGQERQVQGDILVAPGSIAEKVLASALRKGRMTETVLDTALL
jgi:SNF2 family DNA or RNA helicase